MNIFKEDLNKVFKEMLNGLNDPLANSSTAKFLLNNSKYIRSKIALLYIKSYNKSSASIYKILAAGELIHNASLLQDDVIDDADIRRGEISIHKKFSPKIAILLGDYLLAFSIEKLLDIENTEILKLFKNCAKKMCEAEIKQFFLRGDIPEEKDYIEICKNKTAKLFATILESCAITLNLDRDFAKNLGELFGVYFQIKNDLEKNSKEVDYKNQIHTALDVLGIEKTQILLDNYQKEILSLLDKIPDNVYKEELKGLIKNYDK